MENKVYDKIITVGLEERKIKITFPTLGQSSESDLEYSKAYTKALKAGLLPRVSMERQIIESDLWTEKQEAELENGKENLNILIEKYRLTVDKTDKSIFQNQFYELQSNIFKLSSIKESLFNHTAEKKGEEAKVANLAWKCILNEDDTRIWKTQEEFFNEKDNVFVSEVVMAFIKFTSGLDDTINNISNLLKSEFKDSSEEESDNEAVKSVENIKAPEEVKV